MDNINIPFNRPSILGKELEYIRQAVESGKISGDGIFSRIWGEKSAADNILLDCPGYVFYFNKY